MFSLQQNLRRGLNRFCLKARGWEEAEGGREHGGEMAQTMYTHMNKWINNKQINKNILTRIVVSSFLNVW
jgi:hypothetical protein